ncbi:MAG: thioesterase, partial [Actinomycetes bacterium]
MNAPSPTDAAGDQHELWKITLGELDEKMGVKILEESVERVVATMPVEGNRQSFGLLHGGASLAVGEAV